MEKGANSFLYSESLKIVTLSQMMKLLVLQPQQQWMIKELANL